MNYIIEDTRVDLKKDNSNLILQYKKFQTELKLIKEENSELKQSLAGYKHENVVLNQKVFILKGDLASQELKHEQAHQKFNNIFAENQSLTDRFKESKKKVDNLDNIVYEKDNTIILLEKMIDNLKEELNALKKESLKDDSHACHVASLSIFKCEECDFKTENEKGLKIHMGKMHEVKYDTCEEKFGGENKLRSHMCRVHMTTQYWTIFT